MPASELSLGTHNIYFRVKDDDGVWSVEDVGHITIKLPRPKYPPRNLLINPGAETGDMTGWTIIQNGGVGWAVREGGYEGNYSFRTSYDWCKRSQLIDLLDVGLTPEQLDAAPLVFVEEWFGETWDADYYYLKVELLDENHDVIASWDSGVLMTEGGPGYEDDAWYQLAHTFTDYGPGLRYIYWEDGGKDSEFWGGHYGAKLDAASLTIEDIPIDTTPPVISFVPPTPENNSYVSKDWVYVNVSVSDVSDTTAFIDWDNSLVAWYRFNDESGENSTFFKDWSGNGNDATCNGESCPVLTYGKFGKALKFDGNDYLVVPLRIDWDEITVEVWFKPEDVSYSNPRIIANSHTDMDKKGFQIMFNRSGNDGFFDVGNGKAEGRASWTTKIEEGKWYHAVLTYDGSKVRAYINGELVGEASLTGSIADSGYDINIGRNPAYEGDYFKGVIDEIRIFDRALSEEEIKASYNAGLHRLYHNFTDLERKTYVFKAYAQDLAGNVNETEERIVTILPPLTPGVSISTDKYEYTAGDVMLINITLANPTDEWRSVNFLWRLDITDYGLSFPIVSKSLRLPPGFDETYIRRWTLPIWGVSFNATWYVALYDAETSELICDDTADWRYVPVASTGEIVPEEIAKEAVRTIKAELLT